MIAGTGILWLGTLTLAYFAGRNQTASAAADSASSRGTNNSSGNPSAIAGRGNASGSGGATSAAGQASAKPLTVKQILAKAKNAMRGGAMQNPMAMMKVMALLDAIQPADIIAALSEVEGITDPQQKMLLEMTLLAKWAESDGPAAMKYAEEHAAGNGMMAGMSKMGIVSAWAEKDPEAVWKWYKGQPEETGSGMFGSNSMVLASLFASMAARDPDQAFKRLEEIEGQGRTMAIAGMLQSAMFDDEKRQKLFDKVDAMPDETERKQARQMLIGQMAMTAPDQAMEWVRKQPATEQAELRSTMGSMLLMSDPKKGAAFMMEGATEEQKPGLYSQVVSGWAMVDVNAAGTWLKDQPQGPQLDPARQAFVRAASGKDPESAMVWAGTITDPSTRISSTSTAYQAWKKKDPTAADHALGNSGLNTEQMESVRNSPAATDPFSNGPAPVPATTEPVKTANP